MIFSPERYRLAASGDVAPIDRQPLTVGQVAVGTALGSALFWGSLVLAAVVLAPDRPTPNPFAGFRSFDDCERQARARGVRNPAAYCGAIKHRVED